MFFRPQNAVKNKVAHMTSSFVSTAISRAQLRSIGEKLCIIYFTQSYFFFFYVVSTKSKKQRRRVRLQMIARSPNGPSFRFTFHWCWWRMLMSVADSFYEIFKRSYSFLMNYNVVIEQQNSQLLMNFHLSKYTSQAETVIFLPIKYNNSLFKPIANNIFQLGEINRKQPFY